MTRVDPRHIRRSNVGTKCEALCRRLHLNYYIKDDLRKEMEKNNETD